MSRWAHIYEQLIGRPPTAAQISRVDRIRGILQIRDDDSTWYYLVVNEFYVQTINANIKRLTQVGQSAKPAEAATAVSFSSQLRALLSKPLAIAVAGAIVVSIMLSSAGTAILVATIYSRSETQRSLLTDEHRAELEAETRRAVEDALASNAKAVHDATAVRDPRYDGIFEALPAEDQQKLLADPAMTARTLHVVAALPPEAQAAFDVANDPSTREGASQLSAQAWFSAQVTAGNQNASRLIAAFAAGNPAVASILKKLPSSCTLTNWTSCK